MNTPSRVWRRLSIGERGHLSNYPTLCPVVQLGVASQYIEIRRRWGKPKRFPWPSVRITVHKREAHKGYGAYSGGKYIQRLCVIEAGGKTYTFDVSKQFPDFADPDALLAEIGKHTQIVKAPIRRKHWTDWWKFRPW